MCQEIIDRKINHLNWCECSTNLSSKKPELLGFVPGIAWQKIKILSFAEMKSATFKGDISEPRGEMPELILGWRNSAFPLLHPETFRRWRCGVLKGKAVAGWFVTAEFRVLPLLVMFVELILNARWIKEHFQAFLEPSEWLNNLCVNLEFAVASLNVVHKRERGRGSEA